MSAYINTIWCKCDHLDKDGYKTCDKQDVEVSVEVGNSWLFEEGTGVDEKEMANTLNTHFEDMSFHYDGFDYPYGWTAFAERGKKLNIYCPMHASIRILEKNSITLVSAKHELYKTYRVEDFDYTYCSASGGYWYAYEVSRVDNQVLVMEESLTANNKEGILWEIARSQAKLNDLRFQAGLRNGSTAQCEDFINLPDDPWSGTRVFGLKNGTTIIDAIEKVNRELGEGVVVSNNPTMGNSKLTIETIHGNFEMVQVDNDGVVSTVMDTYFVTESTPLDAVFHQIRCGKY